MSAPPAAQPRAPVPTLEAIRADRPHGPRPGRAPRVALLGTPNTGKTTIFNRLSGLRHKTANFPGTTQEARVGFVASAGRRSRFAPAGDCCGRDPGDAAGETGAAPASLELIDLPGVYSLELDQPEAEICRAVLAGELAPRGERVAAPDAVCVVADATNLSRGLVLAGEALRRRLPTVLAVNMIDLGRQRGLALDRGSLASSLGCDVVFCSARTGEGLDDLREAMGAARIPTHTPPGDAPGQDAIARWADDIFARAATAGPEADADTLTDRLDRAFTHPVLGIALFAAIMAGLFWSIFSLARFPMDWIEALFGILGGLVQRVVPAGVLRSLLADGVVAGISGVVVFLPQICLLFFLISLLEDTGYLARAAFVVDRVLRPFGLPGHAFVPLLSSHACALPGIMATRAIPDRRERLATILVAPFMTCSARLPVYVLVTNLLFPHSPMKAALAFIGAYALGIAAGGFSALIARRTILRGKSRPMALELPTYKWPSIRNALLTTYDRALVFLKQAGTNILAICIVLWWLSSFPRVQPPQESLDLRQRAAAVERAQPDRAAELLARADRLEAVHATSASFAGRLGRGVQPVFAPLGYDWQLSVGVLTSFAAREVFVSTMAVVVTGEKDSERAGVIDQIARAKRDDGVTPVFSPGVCWSLLVYYVLAMQCLPTLVVTAREAGGAKWALLQLGWMSGIAYLAAMIVYQAMNAMGAA